MKSKHGSENHQLFSNSVQIGDCLDCFNCGAEDSLRWTVEEWERDDGKTLVAEGLVCRECGDMFMEPETGAKLMNKRSTRQYPLKYYSVVEDEIIESTLH